MLKLCENGSNIYYLYETSSVLRKATETEISGLTFRLRFGFLKTETRFLHIPIVDSAKFRKHLKTQYFCKNLYFMHALYFLNFVTLATLQKQRIANI